MTEYRPTDFGGVPQPPPGRRGMKWGPVIAVIGAVLIAAGITVWASLSDTGESAEPSATPSASAEATSEPPRETGPAWVTMTPDGQDFSMDLPQQPETHRVHQNVEGYGELAGTAYELKLDQKLMGLSTFELGSAISEDSVDSLFDAMTQTIENGGTGSRGYSFTVTSTEDTSIDGERARHLAATLVGDGMSAASDFLITYHDGKLYLLVAVSASPGDFDRMVDSFRYAR